MIFTECTRADLPKSTRHHPLSVCVCVQDPDGYEVAVLPSTALNAEPVFAVLLCDADFIRAMLSKMYNFES